MIEFKKGQYVMARRIQGTTEVLCVVIEITRGKKGDWITVQQIVSGSSGKPFKTRPSLVR